MALQVDSHVPLPVVTLPVVTLPVAVTHNTPASLQHTPAAVAATVAKAKPVTPSEPTVKTPVPVAAVAAAPVDTVKLSLSAHIHLLKSQGQDAQQIATSLGVDTKTVDNFLNTEANEPPVPAPLPGSASTDSTGSASASATTAAAPVVPAKVTVAQTALDVSQVGAAA